jgi:FixJ family two-component response regulator
MIPPARRIYLIDDDEAVRSALRLLLETIGLEVITFADPVTFLKQLPELPHGCLVIDIRMPVLSGLKLQERLAEAQCDWPAIVISGHGDIDACRQAFKNGAIDFLSKPVDEQDLIDAIQKGHSQLDNRATAKAERAEAVALVGQLTPREQEVLDMLSRGFSTRDIAESLGNSPRTIESHRAHIAAKLGTTSAAEFARILIQAGKTP